MLLYIQSIYSSLNSSFWHILIYNVATLHSADHSNFDLWIYIKTITRNFVCRTYSFVIQYTNEHCIIIQMQLELRKRRKFIGLSQYFIRQLKIKATCYIWFCLCINKIFFGCVSVRSNSRRIICNNTSVLFRHINVFSHKKYKMRLNAKHLIVVATAFVTRIWMIWHFIGFLSTYSDWKYNKIAYNLLI